jgi:hypothetical protein
MGVIGESGFYFSSSKGFILPTTHHAKVTINHTNASDKDLGLLPFGWMASDRASRAFKLENESATWNIPKRSLGSIVLGKANIRYDKCKGESFRNTSGRAEIFIGKRSIKHWAKQRYQPTQSVRQHSISSLIECLT